MILNQFLFSRGMVIKAHYRDMICVSIVTLLTFSIARYFNLSERLYQWSRLWEQYQADELSFPLLAFSICLIWFSWRRYLEAKTESTEKTTLLSENRRLIRSQIEQQEHERLFLAQELHDVFAQYLIALRSHGELIQTLTTDNNSQLRQAAQKIIDNVDKLQNVTRSLLKTLRPPLLQFGIAMAIEDLVTEWQQTHQQILCQLDFHGDEPNLKEEELLVIYRTIQEGLSNAAKHSNASHIDIDLYFPSLHTPSPTIINLQLINDGVIDSDKKNSKSGLGLIGIRERASMLDGHFDLSAYPPQ